MSNGEPGARLGLIVGKRQLKNAVDRNYVKRVLRETFRTHHATLPALDIVVQLTQAPREESIYSEAQEVWDWVAHHSGSENADKSA